MPYFDFLFCLSLIRRPPCDYKIGCNVKGYESTTPPHCPLQSGPGGTDVGHITMLMSALQLMEKHRPERSPGLQGTSGGLRGFIRTNLWISKGPGCPGAVLHAQEPLASLSKALLGVTNECLCMVSSLFRILLDLLYATRAGC